MTTCLLAKVSWLGILLRVCHYNGDHQCCCLGHLYDHALYALCCRYGFVVYGDGTVTDVACKGLNGMRMGDRTLTVRRATEVTSSFYAVPGY